MTLRNLHSFGSGRAAVGTTNGAVVVDSGLDSGYAHSNTVNSTLTTLAPGFTAGSLSTMVIAGARCKLSSATTATNVLVINRGGGTADYCMVRQEAGGAYTIYVATAITGTTISLGTIGVPAWDATVYNYYEVAWIPSDSAGTCLFRVNGVAPTGWTDVLPASSTDTRASSSTSTTYAVGSYRYSNNATINMGDVVLYDDVNSGDGWNPSGTTLIGPVRMRWRTSQSSGTSDFTGSDGNSVDNHLLVDDIPSDTTDYLDSATSGHRQILGHGSSIAVAGTVLAVQSEMYGRDSDSGSQQFKLGTRSSGSETTGTFTLSPSDGLYQLPVPRNPNGGGAWGAHTGAAATSESVIEVV